MHKGVFGENVQNSKIKSQNAQSLHVPVRTMNRGLDKNIGPKCEKWLDSKAFEVYTALVSHNGLVRQKGSCTGSGWTVLTEKFVKSDELPWRIRVDLCVCAQI